MKTLIIGLLLTSQTVYATMTDMKFTRFFSDSLETKFWKYFQSQVGNADSYAHSLDKQKLITDKLNEYFPGLGLGVLTTFIDGKKKTQIYVTAYGDKSKFPTIDNLVKKSPKTDKYNIIAFAPPSYLYDSITFNGKSIPTGNIEFSYKKNGNELDISLFFPNKPIKADNEFDLALQTVLLEFLGELQFSKLGLVDILDMDKKQSGQQTKKLKELYSFMTSEIK